MPTLIIIDGIRIVMYPSDHPPPHVHAWKNGRDAQFEIATGRVMEGQMDRKSIRTVQAWITLNQDLLLEAWTYCQTPNSTTTKS